MDRSSRKLKWRFAAAFAAVSFCLLFSKPVNATRVIEITADRDSRYKIPGQRKPTITAVAGEELLFHITANKGSSENRDGSVHGFTLLRAKDRSKMPGWDFLLKPGVQEILVRAPSQPGNYEVVCTVICTQDHEGMHMSFVVLPAPAKAATAARVQSSEHANAVVAGAVQTFRGEIADTQCALNVHSLTRSHAEMIKGKMGTDAASCARHCVGSMGGTYGLLEDDKTFYRLNDQPRAASLAGRKVRITGVVDRSTNTVQVRTIEAVE